MPILQKIKQLSAQLAPDIITIRRHLHQHPELSFQEVETSAYIASVLDAHSISYTSGHVKTGLVAMIKGKNPTKKTILLRADMDALPIEENNNVPYCSVNKGVMHACGHDVHSASVLGTAIILNQLKDEFEGTVKIMFQPGEEVLPGGASLMIKENVLKNPDVNLAIAQHVFPSMEVGKVGFRSGMYMASTDEIHITITGKGGHAAMAAEYNNPITSAAKLISAIENEFKFTIDAEGVARNLQNDIPTVVVFGNIEAKGATNVIPEQVTLAGTIRTMDEQWRKTIKEKIKQIASEIAHQHKVVADVRIIDGYPFLVNDNLLTEKCKHAAIEYLGKDKVEDLPIRMTAEDFAYISQQVPSCFYRLGTANKSKGITSGVHTSSFDIDESALELSIGLMAWLSITELNA